MREAATHGEYEGLAGVDLTGVAECGIGAGNALPSSAVAVMRERDFPKRIALMNQHVSDSSGNRRRRGPRDDQDRARLDELRVEQSLIDGKPLPPTEACAEETPGEFPERVARLNGDS